MNDVAVMVVGVLALLFLCLVAQMVHELCHAWLELNGDEDDEADD